MTAQRGVPVATPSAWENAIRPGPRPRSSGKLATALALPQVSVKGPRLALTRLFWPASRAQGSNPHTIRDAVAGVLGSPFHGYAIDYSRSSLSLQFPEWYCHQPGTVPCLSPVELGTYTLQFVTIRDKMPPTRRHLASSPIKADEHL